MAIRGNKPCKKPGCPNLAPPGSVWCQTHKAEETRIGTWVRKSGRLWREDAGYGNSGWQVEKMRRAVLARDHYQCQGCGHQADPENMKPKELHADHIRPISQGGTTGLRNMQTLCGPCHDGKTKADIARARENTS